MLISSQLVKKFSIFFVTRKFVIVFTTTLFLGVGGVKEKSGIVNKILERLQFVKLIGDYWDLGWRSG